VPSRSAQPARRKPSLPALACREQLAHLCQACVVFSSVGTALKLLSNSHRSMAAKNMRLLKIWKLSRSLPCLGWTKPRDRVASRTKTVTALLCRLLCCGPNLVYCLRNVDRLAELVPPILSLTALQDGWSLLWNELRKIATAVGK